MTQEIAGSMMLALMVVALGLAGWGWYRKVSRHRPLTRQLRFEFPVSQPLLTVEALYVATTEVDTPLARIAAGPLAYRSKASLSLHPEGLYVRLKGSDPIVFPQKKLQAGLATWTIDRAVEPEGLMMVRWELGEQEVESYFRVVDGDVGEVVSMIGSLQEKKS
jgi:hypothetical protein